MGSIPESIGLQYTVAVAAELIPGRDGHSIDVAADVASAPVKLTGKPGEVMTVYARRTDMTFQVGGPNVQATRASNVVVAGSQVPFTLGGTTTSCTHISFFGLDGPGEAIVNFYRRGA